MALTNTTGIPLSLAVWLAHDEYSVTGGVTDVPEGEIISATTLLKPLRQLILTQRIPPEERKLDLTDLIASRMGHALHDSVEKAWRNAGKGLKKLGFSDTVIEAIRVNPEVEEKGTIPVYLEKRVLKKFGKYVISGQLDQVIEGSLKDTKSTSVFSYLSGNKDEDYIWQLSIYRWLNPDIVKSDIADINFIFTDWQRARANADPNYPQRRVETINLQLKSLEETEQFIKRRLDEYEANKNKPEPEIVECTDKELWKGESVFKYFKDPAKAAQGGRATKNFDTDKAAAYKYLREMNSVGIVIEFPGVAKACGYCPAYDSCSQKDRHEHERF